MYIEIIQWVTNRQTITEGDIMTFTYYYDDARTFPGSLNRLREMVDIHAIRIIPKRYHYEVTVLNFRAYNYIYTGTFN